MEKAQPYTSLFKLEEKFDAVLASLPKSTRMALAKVLSYDKGVDINATDFTKFNRIVPTTLMRDPRRGDPNYVYIYVAKVIEQYGEVLPKPQFKLIFAETGGKALNTLKSTSYKKWQSFAFDELSGTSTVENYSGQKLEVKNEVNAKRTYHSYISNKDMTRKQLLKLSYRVYILDMNLIDKNIQTRLDREEAKSGMIKRDPNVKFDASVAEYGPNAGKPKNIWTGITSRNNADKSGYTADGYRRLRAKLEAARVAAFEAENESTEKVLTAYTNVVKKALDSINQLTDTATMMEIIKQIHYDILEAYKLTDINSYDKQLQRAQSDQEEKGWIANDRRRSIAEVRKSFDRLNNWIKFISTNPVGIESVRSFRNAA